MSRFRKVCGRSWTSFLTETAARREGLLLSVSHLTLSVSKSDESARTNRNVFQEVTHRDRKIEQILNMFQKETQ